MNYDDDITNMNCSGTGFHDETDKEFGSRVEYE